MIYPPSLEHNGILGAGWQSWAACLYGFSPGICLPRAAHLLIADSGARARLSLGEQLCCLIFISSSCCLGLLSSHSKGSAVDVFSYLFCTHLSTAAEKFWVKTLWLHLKTFLQWRNSAEHLGTRKPSAGMTNPGREYLCVAKTSATIPTTQPQFLTCPEKQAASQRRCHGVAQLSAAEKDAGCVPRIPAGEHGAGTVSHS